MLFRDMPDKALYEIHNRESFFYICVIFVAVIVERNSITIIVVNSGSGDYRSAKIAANIFGDHFGIAKVGFGIDIETVFMLGVAFCFYCFKGRTNPAFHFIEKSSTEGVAEIIVIKVFDMTPEAVITVAAFGKEAVDVRVPFEISAKSMQDHDVAGGEIFGMV